jgi:S-adenosyl methyltransferase
VYDYILGGKDNFAADRETAELSLKLVPEMLDSSRGNREFLVRAVRFLRDAGIRQFLDIGTGLPTSPNTHETAQEGHPDARVVYVDNDPVVFLHAEALMADDATTAVVRADLRDVDEVLTKAAQLLDFTRPVALMFVAVLHCIDDEDDPAAIAGRYMDALAPGSYLIISPLHRRVRARADAPGLGRSQKARRHLDPPRQGRHPALVQRPGTHRPRSRARLPLAAGRRGPRRQRRPGLVLRRHRLDLSIRARRAAAEGSRLRAASDRKLRCTTW